MVKLGFASLEERVETVLREFGITCVNKTVGGKDNGGDGESLLYQILAPEPLLESLLLRLQKAGVGAVAGTGLTVIQSQLSYCGERADTVDGDTSHPSTQNTLSSNKETRNIAKFYRSIKSRLVVAEVIKRIESNAEFSFDYVCLVVVAACLAFMGLVENSSVILVASMLVSPIMGPILSIVFGTCIRNTKLIKIGCRRELYSIFICILCGFIFGVIFVVKFNRTQNLLAVTSANWPTTEMSSRTGWSCLVVGLAIAIPSGVGVAISVLGGNSGSMVGVAISASLLPPAVNTGLYWSMALFSVFDLPPNTPVSTVNTTEVIYNGQVFCGIQTMNAATHQLETFRFEYAGCGDVPAELFFRGAISLVLTGLNILCIVVVGVLILLVKQVTPEKIPQRNAAFWRKDILLNRQYEKSLQETVEGITGEGTEGLSGTFFEALFEEAARDKEVVDSRLWVDTNYPTDDLNKISDKSASLLDISSGGNPRFVRAGGRFQVVPALRSLRRDTSRSVAAIIQEEVQNVIQVQARGILERRGSMQDIQNRHSLDLLKRSSLPRISNV